MPGVPVVHLVGQRVNGIAVTRSQVAVKGHRTATTGQDTRGHELSDGTMQYERPLFLRAFPPPTLPPKP